jgi:hypothetical protein
MAKQKILITDELEAFLKKEKVLTKFKTNAASLSVKYSDISEAFDWSTSPEGFDFWNKLDNKC